MSSLRRRLGVATGALLGLQVVGTTLGFVSWWRVNQAFEMQQEIGRERDELLGVAAAARELYVHQAHTFIEGGPGHLDHLGEDAIGLAQGLRVRGITGPLAVETAAILLALDASNLWFEAEVAPLARAGRLDREAASRLHEVGEGHAARVQAEIQGALVQLAAAEAGEVARVSQETRRAWIYVASVVVTGLLLGAVVSGRLARGILGPLDALGRGVRAFGERQDARVPTSGDDEIAVLGRAFNQMVDRVRAAEARLVERERIQALGEIAGAVAHELMSPIGAILGETRAVPIDGARIRAEADHARRVIQGLLGYARPGESEPTDVRVDEAAAAAAERAVLFADARGTHVRWIGGDPAVLRGAPTAVRQVLDNLIRNAIDAGGEVEVEVRAGAVEVRDRGGGIPSQVRARLYEPFVTGRPDGTGLGLAVSQRIAHALGGRIVHQDREGGGTLARWELKHG